MTLVVSLPNATRRIARLRRVMSDTAEISMSRVPALTFLVWSADFFDQHRDVPHAVVDHQGVHAAQRRGEIRDAAKRRRRRTFLDFLGRLQRLLLHLAGAANEQPRHAEG